MSSRNPAASNIGPVAETERLESIDVIRGVALLGILLMNIVGMGLPDPAYGDPSSAGGATGWNLWTWIITNVCFEGTMRAMFSMLFGAGVLLFTARSEKDQGLSVADAWYRRLIWLFLFGFVHAYLLLWPGEILYAYGLLGMFLFPMRNLSASRLAILGVALLLTGAVISILENRDVLQQYPVAMEAESIIKAGGTLTEEQTAAKEFWEGKMKEMKPDQKTKDDVVKGIRGGYLSAIATKAPFTVITHTSFYYRYAYFDILSMMLVGMACFKASVLQAKLPNRTYALMVLIGYGIGVPVNLYETMTFLRSEFSLVTYYKVALTYDVGRLSMVTGHVGLVMLMCRNRWLQGLQRALSAVGRMAITNYISHTLITTMVFVVFAQFGLWERHQLYYLVFAIWIFQLVISPLWLQHFYFGPMEWLWRRLTYMKGQPFRRKMPIIQTAESTNQ